MPQLRYSVAASLDGFIAGPHNEYDWIVADPEIDFAAIYAGFSAIVMGRRSYEITSGAGDAPQPSMPTYVYSRTLPEGTRNGVTFVHDAIAHVRSLKASTEKKPIWLWGGGELFRSLAAAKLVDGVDLAIIPVMLGEGVPLLPSPQLRLPLKYRKQRLYPATGTLFVEYDITR